MLQGDDWYLVMEVLAGIFFYGAILASWPRPRRAAKRIMAVSALAEAAVMLAYALSPDSPRVIDHLGEAFQRVLGG